MEKQIVIATHANLARGFEASMRFIVAPLGNVYTICAFTEDGNPGEAFDRLISRFDKSDVVIVLTDLLPGSVNKEIALRLSEYKFHLITGINLAVLLGLACCAPEDVNEEYIREIVSLGKDAVIYVNEQLKPGADEEGFW